jgi:hypothetical protein
MRFCFSDYLYIIERGSGAWLFAERETCGRGLATALVYVATRRRLTVPERATGLFEMTMRLARSSRPETI